MNKPLVLCCLLVGSGVIAQTSHQLNLAIRLRESARNIPARCVELSLTPVSCTELSSSDALMPHPDDCQLFYYCEVNRAAPTCRQCPAGLHFNPTLHVCDWPQNAGCTAHAPTNTTPAPVLTTTTPAPVSSTTTPAPVSSTTTPAPVSSTMTPAPVSSTTTPAPVSSTTTPAPVSSTTTPAPVSSTTTPAPALSDTTLVPTTDFLNNITAPIFNSSISNVTITAGAPATITPLSTVTSNETWPFSATWPWWPTTFAPESSGATRSPFKVTTTATLPSNATRSWGTTSTHRPASKNSTSASVRPISRPPSSIPSSSYSTTATPSAAAPTARTTRRTTIGWRLLN